MWRSLFGKPGRYRVQFKYSDTTGQASESVVLRVVVVEPPETAKNAWHAVRSADWYATVLAEGAWPLSTEAPSSNAVGQALAFLKQYPQSPYSPALAWALGHHYWRRAPRGQEENTDVTIAAQRREMARQCLAQAAEIAKGLIRENALVGLCYVGAAEGAGKCVERVLLEFPETRHRPTLLSLIAAQSSNEAPEIQWYQTIKKLEAEGYSFELLEKQNPKRNQEYEKQAAQLLRQVQEGKLTNEVFYRKLGELAEYYLRTYCVPQR
ncbi:MAG: hypothetical protein NZ483_05900 [Verrucomicrobiae bacterium]|nr:hypothetical protein [Verrucomicrobiae bacterium]